MGNDWDGKQNQPKPAPKVPPPDREWIDSGSGPGWFRTIPPKKTAEPKKDS